MAIRVLVVDDTAHVRRMLTTMLNLDGFEVVGEVADGSQAVEAVAAAPPDVVVMDYRLPGMDGLEAARRLRADHPAVQVVIYTAYAEPEVEEAAAAIGVAVCVAKAEGLSVLEAEIRRLVR